MNALCVPHPSERCFTLGAPAGHGPRQFLFGDGEGHGAPADTTFLPRRAVREGPLPLCVGAFVEGLDRHLRPDDANMDRLQSVGLGERKLESDFRDLELYGAIDNRLRYFEPPWLRK